MGEFSNPTSTLPKIVFDFFSCGYTSDEVRDALHVEHMLKEDNCIENIQSPPSTFQQERELNEAPVEMPN